MAMAIRVIMLARSPTLVPQSLKVPTLLTATPCPLIPMLHRPVSLLVILPAAIELNRWLVELVPVPTARFPFLRVVVVLTVVRPLIPVRHRVVLLPDPSLPTVVPLVGIVSRWGNKKPCVQLLDIPISRLVPFRFPILRPKTIPTIYLLHHTLARPNRPIYLQQLATLQDHVRPHGTILLITCFVCGTLLLFSCSGDRGSNFLKCDVWLGEPC